MKESILGQLKYKYQSFLLREIVLQMRARGDDSDPMVENLPLTDNAGRVSDDKTAAIPTEMVGDEAVARAGQLQGHRRLLVHILQ